MRADAPRPTDGGGVRRSSRGQSDAGSGTVLAIGLVAAIAVLAIALGAVGGVLIARSRAQTAADLAALSAASAVSVPPGVSLAGDAELAADPCGRADEVAVRNAGRLTGCSVGPLGVVTVTVRVPHRLVPATARAVAGPAWVRRVMPWGRGDARW